MPAVKAGIVHIADTGVKLDNLIQNGIELPGEAEQDVKIIHTDVGDVLPLAQPAGYNLIDLLNQRVPRLPAIDPVEGTEALYLQADERVLPPLCVGKRLILLPYKRLVSHPGHALTLFPFIST